MFVAAVRALVPHGTGGLPLRFDRNERIRFNLLVCSAIQASIPPAIVAVGAGRQQEGSHACENDCTCPCHSSHEYTICNKEFARGYSSPRLPKRPHSYGWREASKSLCEQKEVLR